MKPTYDIETHLPGEISYVVDLIAQLEQLFSQASATGIHLQILSLKLYRAAGADDDAPRHELFSYLQPGYREHPSHEALGYELNKDQHGAWIWDPAIEEILTEDPPMQGLCPGCLRVHDPQKMRIAELFFNVERSAKSPINEARLNKKGAKAARADESLAPATSLMDSVRALDETLMTGQTFEQIAEAVLDNAYQLLPEVCHASVTSFNHEEKSTRLVAIRSTVDTKLTSGMTLSLDHLHPGPNEIIKSFHIITDLAGMENPIPVLGMACAEGLRSVISLPLACGDDLFGSLNFARAHTGEFGEDFIKVSQLLASRLSLVIHRNRYEEQLRRSEENYRFLTQNITDLIVKVDSQGRFLFVNTPYCKTFNMSEGELIGSDFMPLVHPDDQVATMKAMEKLFEPPHHCYVEQRAMTGDGWRWLAWVDTAVLNEDGEVESIIGVGRDITELKEAEAARKKMEDQLQHTQKLESLGVLAGGIAHDFNNLLTGIMGNASLALLSQPPDSPSQVYLEHIELAAERAGELCKQMLAYSGRGQFIITHLDLSEMVREISNFLRHSISKKARLNFHLEDNLPAIEGDPNQIRQVVMNLITNAAEALDGKAGAITITTGIMEGDFTNIEHVFTSGDLDRGPYAYIQVADTGCGMSKDTLSKIFDPFFTTKFTGRGLGLAAVLGIVRGHEGALQVKSILGEGTVFRVMLPCMERPVHKTRPMRPVTADIEGGGTILVIDDEEAVRSVATQMLRRVGYDVLLADDGVMGINIFKKYHASIAAVLLDLTMPHMDGKEVFDEIRMINPDVPVILTSGYTMQDAMNTFDDKDLAGFLQKPFNAGEVIHVMHNALAAASDPAADPLLEPEDMDDQLAPR